MIFRTRTTRAVLLGFVALALIGGFYYSVQSSSLLESVLDAAAEENLRMRHDDDPTRVKDTEAAGSEDRGRDGSEARKHLGSEEAPLRQVYAEGLFAPTLHLTKAEDAVVRQRQAHRAAGCPNRFIFVNTHTYGRHHNQLQEMLNLAMWSRSLGRTAVLGWFRFDHKWTFASDLYNFTRIMESYCLITPQQMVARVKADKDLSAQKNFAACFGQGVHGTPMKKAAAGLFRCRPDPTVPAHYNTRMGMNTTRSYFAERVMKAAEALVVVSGQIGFFMRAGLAENAAIYGLLEPSEHIRALVDTFKVATFGKRALSEYFGIHLRQREKECMKEVVESREDGGSHLAHMTDDDWKIIATQCSMTVAHLQSLMSSLNLLIDHQPMFLGSDHQNMVLEKALVDLGASMFTTEQSLTALAVDYFLMSEGRYFTGNQLSSITQNICYRRLGKGKGCEGFVPPFARYHSRNVETGLSWIQEGLEEEARGGM